MRYINLLLTLTLTLFFSWASSLYSNTALTEYPGAILLEIESAPLSEDEEDEDELLARAKLGQTALMSKLERRIYLIQCTVGFRQW